MSEKVSAFFLLSCLVMPIPTMAILSMISSYPSPFPSPLGGEGKGEGAF
jgi:hypothetical protein